MFELGVSPQDFMLAFFVVVFGAFVQGTAGFGLALLVGPLLTMIDPVFLPGPVVIIVGFLTAMMAFKERASVDSTHVKKTILGYVAGTGIAATLLSKLPQQEMAFLLGGLILFAVAISVLGLRVVPSRKILLSAGVLGGFMGTVSGVGLPPLAIALQNESGPRLRGTLACVGSIGIIMAEIALVAVGRIGFHELQIALCLVPGVVLGYMLSIKTIRLFDRNYTRPAVFTLSILSAVTLILRNV